MQRIISTPAHLEAVDKLSARCERAARVEAAHAVRAREEALVVALASVDVAERVLLRVELLLPVAEDAARRRAHVVPAFV